MDKNELVSQWTDAAKSGSLLTLKHDPGNLGTSCASYRSILTPQLSSSLEQFISSADYTINFYEDSRYPKGLGYFEVTPVTGSTFKVPGSGVPSGSITPTEALDRLVIVSGQKQGWHIYAESSSFISGSVVSGRLTLSASFV